MSCHIGTVRNVRVFVEPVDVELEDDGGILWTSLQTAFPGCSGLYYRDVDATCRSSVKFDGKKFCPPGGAWNDRQYYVTLSQRCHSTAQPFGSYENASKQFERSVNAVQKMFGATLFDATPRQRRPKLSSPVNSADTKSESSVTADPVVHSIKEREDSLQQQSASGRNLSSIEQQFVDLAKISTGKDMIIDQHRETIRTLQEKNAELEKSLKEAERKCDDLSLEIKAREEELQMFRNMSDKQVRITDQVATLTKNLMEKDTELQKVTATLTAEINKKAEELEQSKLSNEELSNKLEDVLKKMSSLEEEHEVAIVSRNLLSKELDQLRPLAELIEIGDVENVQTYASALEEVEATRREIEKAQREREEAETSHSLMNQMQTAMARDNARLNERNQELEQRIANIDKDLVEINEEWKAKLKRKSDEIASMRLEFEEDRESQRKQLESVQKMLESATRDAAEQSRRCSELHQSCTELRRHLESAESKHQEELRVQKRLLTEKLREQADQNENDLRSLVASLKSDVHSSQRDISDMI